MPVFDIEVRDTVVYRVTVTAEEVEDAVFMARKAVKDNPTEFYYDEEEDSIVQGEGYFEQNP